MLKKREEKVKRKMEVDKAKKAGTFGLTEEDKVIMKKVKGKKKEVKKRRARETDEFDDMFEQYKTKIMKGLEKGKAEGPKFEEIEVSSMEE